MRAGAVARRGGAAATGIDQVLPRDEFAAARGAASRATSARSTRRFGPRCSAKRRPPIPRRCGARRKRIRGTAGFRAKSSSSRSSRPPRPQAAIADLDPIIDALRAIKSPREIAVIREATRITGLGIMEAMRDARPGMKEYELQADAEFVFKKWGAYGPSYFALIATGTNTYYSHYHKNTATLKDGDLVQFDYAPDYKYYQSDVTRVFPANGTFTPRQREFYTIYLKLYQAVMTSIRCTRPGRRSSRTRCRRWTRSWRRSPSPIRRSRRRRRRSSRATAPSANARALGPLGRHGSPRRRRPGRRPTSRG